MEPHNLDKLYCEWCGSGPECGVCGRDDEAAQLPLWAVFAASVVVTAAAMLTADVVISLLMVAL